MTTTSLRPVAALLIILLSIPATQARTETVDKNETITVSATRTENVNAPKKSDGQYVLTSTQH